MTNGFQSIPEIQAFCCSDKNCAPFSLPVEALSLEPTPEDVITTFKNGDKERKIHCNTVLEAYELERLNELRKEAKAHGVAFYPSVAVMATRFLSRARMDARKALKLMQATQAWRENYFKGGPVTDEAVREDMQHGVVYFVGRDVALRPALVIRASRIPKQWYKEKRTDRLIRLLIFCMEYLLRFMLVPGRVENLSVIVDLTGLGLSQVPISALTEVYKVMSHHYIGRVYKFYVCNASPTLFAIAGMAKSILTDRQRQKLNILDNVSELRKDFVPDQLEKDLGGTREVVKRFLPFPLEHGPFKLQSGVDKVPTAAAVSGVHAVLSDEGAAGRLWDPKQTYEENTRLDYAPGAAAILHRCGRPLPWEFRLPLQEAVGAPSQGEPSPPVSDACKEDGSKTTLGSRNSESTSPGLSEDSFGKLDSNEDLEGEIWKGKEEDFQVVIEEECTQKTQDNAVTTSFCGFFSSRPSWCA